MISDLYATILRSIGLDHEKLTYRFNGRDMRLTDVHGHVIKEALEKNLDAAGQGPTPQKPTNVLAATRHICSCRFRRG